MANRVYAPHQGSLTPGIVTLTGRVVLGVNGAISDQSKCRGFSVARVSAGLYTVTLNDSYNEIHDITVTIFTAGAVPAASRACGYTIPLSTDTITAGTGKTFQFQLLQNNSTAADADDNGEIRLEFTLVNSRRTF